MNLNGIFWGRSEMILVVCSGLSPFGCVRLMNVEIWDCWTKESTHLSSVFFAESKVISQVRASSDMINASPNTKRNESENMLILRHCNANSFAHEC